MEALLISACLLGVNCKYSGGSNALPGDVLARLRAKYWLIPVCPETAGGLPIPREPCERRGGRVVSCSGRDCTAEYTHGAEIAVRLAARFGCTRALLKENSPSCGFGTIYDGSFSHTLVPGSGVAAEALAAHGVTVIGESRLAEL